MMSCRRKSPAGADQSGGRQRHPPGDDRWRRTPFIARAVRQSRTMIEQACLDRHIAWRPVMLAPSSQNRTEDAAQDLAADFAADGAGNAAHRALGCGFEHAFAAATARAGAAAQQAA